MFLPAFAGVLEKVSARKSALCKKISLETGKLLLFTQKGVDFREKCGKASESYQTERNLGEFCRGMFQGLSSVTQSWTVTQNLDNMGKKVYI